LRCARPLLVGERSEAGAVSCCFRVVTDETGTIHLLWFSLQETHGSQDEVEVQLMLAGGITRQNRLLVRGRRSKGGAGVLGKGLCGFQVRLALHPPPKGLQRFKRAAALPSLGLVQVVRRGETRMDVVRRRPRRGRCAQSTVAEALLLLLGPPPPKW